MATFCEGSRVRSEAHGPDIPRPHTGAIHCDSDTATQKLSVTHHY